MSKMQVPFFRASLTDVEIDEAVASLRSGWLTTGPRVRQFEQEFAEAVGAKYAIALNSCTAALHVAVEALGLKAGDAVLVPTHTFAATAEVVRYIGAYPVLVDCVPGTLHMDLADAERRISLLRSGKSSPAIPKDAPIVGIMPVHIAGRMMDIAAIREFATHHNLWVVEDAAHSFPAAWRPKADAPWQRCGEGTSDIACFSFYANKTITTGEGGMATTNNKEWADRMRLMSLHGLSHDAWDRYTGGRTWDYRIVAPGFKYNMTDVAGALGLQQLRRAEAMRTEREKIVEFYYGEFAGVDAFDVPPRPVNERHSWHLFPISLNVERIGKSRNEVIDALKDAGVGCSVHWRPLHLHNYYVDTFGWKPEDFPVATREWERLISLPLFPGMTRDEMQYVADTVKAICGTHAAKAQHA